jgi:hypothetical protein
VNLELGRDEMLGEILDVEVELFWGLLEVRLGDFEDLEEELGALFRQIQLDIGRQRVQHEIHGLNDLEIALKHDIFVEFREEFEKDVDSGVLRWEVLFEALLDQFA